MKRIFVVHDYFTKESVIPNGFNMSYEEFNEHRYKLSRTSNVKFKNDSLFLQLTPIHKSTILSSNFLTKDDKIYYFVHLNRNAGDYPELYDYGMNHWTSYIDEKIIELIKKKKVTLALSIFIETLTLQDIKIIGNRLLSHLGEINFEIWTPWTYPKEDWIRVIGSLKYYRSIVDVPYWEISAKKLYNTTGLIINHKSKKYINLCRRYTPERILAHTYILSHNLLDLGYNSIPSHDTITGRSLIDVARDLLDSYSGIFNNEISLSLSYWKENDQGITLDQPPVSDFDRTLHKDQYYGFNNSPDLEKYYNDSYLSLIGEGCMTVDSYMITEKTYRSILYKHLFLIIGPKHTLQSLREKGYKTFNSIWSEEYDNIDDDGERIQTVLKLFENIIISNNLETLYEKALPIIEHNYNFMHERIENYIKNTGYHETS